VTLEEALDALYATPPAEFTSRRDAIARDLAQAGATADAKTLKAMRKPTTVAYALNQLARRYPDDVASLVDVGRDLARAERKAVRSGGGGGDLRDAIAKQRAIVRDLTQKATRLVRELDLGAAAHVDQMAAAFQTALVDPAAGAALEAGRLDKAPERASAAFGAIAPEDLPLAPRAPEKTPKKTKKADESKKTEKRDQARKAQEAARRAREEAAAQKAAATRQAREQARREADAQAAEAGRAAAEAERLEAEAARAVAAAKDARAKAAKLARAASRAARAARR
jgi:hypothetical protein